MSASEEDQIKKLIEANPGVDSEQLEELRRLHEQLEQQGLGKRRYAIVSPYERRPLRHASPDRWAAPKGEPSD